MASIAFDIPLEPQTPAVIRRARAVLRLWRLAQRRRQARLLLARETSDPHVYADCGFVMPARSGAERWIGAMIHHQH